MLSRYLKIISFPINIGWKKSNNRILRFWEVKEKKILYFYFNLSINKSLRFEEKKFILIL